jgi:thiamine-phosphate pyrophosphorylase
MPLDLKKPILYLITAGTTTEASTPESKEFENILALVRAAAAAGIHLVQIREKDLTARHLFELTVRAAEITRGTSTRVLVNDRADVAAAAGADGVHLSTRSLPSQIVRDTFGRDFLIGASTHSLAEAMAAREGGADFAVFGPVFETASKTKYGPALGVPALRQVALELAPFPILALGGISKANAADCVRAGARGIAAIRLFSDAETLAQAVNALRL